MKTILKKLFDIREGEESNALLMFSYIFLIIASLLIVKPVRNSLFLTHFGISRLPYAFILVALAAAAITNFYSNWSQKIRLNILIRYSTFIYIGSLLFFWLLLYFNYKAGWFYYAFYTWVALFGVIATSQIWLLANYVFNAREAKRLFGFVGAGAISGGIFGGYSTRLLAPLVGTDNMLLFCIAFLIICLFILRTVWKKTARFHYQERISQEKRVIKRQSDDHIFKIILKSRHLTYLAGIIGVGVVVANLVDYQFSAVASDIIKDEDQLTAFFGFWLSNLSIASLVVQLFLTGRILKRSGVTTSLFFLPVGILIGAVSIFLTPALWAAVLIKVSDGGLKQSINKAGLELLALPIPSSIKNQSKAFIDVFVDSLATGIGGFLLILFTKYLGFSTSYISFIIIAFITFWCYLIIRIRYEYINSFRMALEKRNIDLETQTINPEDASVLESLIRVLEGKNERQILYVLHLIENLKNKELIPYLKKLIHHRSPEIKVQVLKIINFYDDENFTVEAEELIADENFDVKVEAIRYLFHHADNGNTILMNLLVSPDYKIRSAALLCTAQAYRRHSEFRNTIDMRLLFDHFIDQCYETDYDKNELNFMKMTLTQVIGATGNPELYPFLENLLLDHNPEVVRAALSSAGMTRDPNFIPILIRHLDTSLVRKYAREALAQYGEDVIDVLDNHLSNPEEIPKIRLGIPKVLALIGSQKSVDTLLSHLTQSDLLLRHEIIRALNRLKVNFPNLKFHRESINQQIIDETKYYYKVLNLVHKQNELLEEKTNVATLNKNSRRIDSAQKLLMKALEEKLEVNLERIFRLLGLRYPSKDMYNAYLGVVSNKEDLRANAIEFLDNILDADFKKLIIPIVEENLPGHLIKKSQVLFGFNVPSEIECMEFLLQGDDNWLKACTIHLLAEMKSANCKDFIQRLVEDSDLIVKGTAQYYFERIGSS
jgi:AAA family ATP:ADP antiporter